MKILILGGTGLISTAITRELLQQGADVTLFNRGQTEDRTPDGAKSIHGDRNDFPAFEQQMAEAGQFDCVLDMICFRPDQAESAIRAFKGRTGHFIFCSTVDVYAKPAQRYPLLENAPRRGNNDYGRNKIVCEDLFMAAHNRGDFPVTIIRPAMTYGEGRGIVGLTGWNTHIFDRIRRGKPIVVHGDGTALWVAAHVDDVSHAFAHAAGNPVTFGKAYHVTGEEWLTWNRYYQLIAEAIGAPQPHLVHIPTDLLVKIAPEKAALCRDNFSGNNIFDNTAARTDLDFHYRIPWREGVKRAYQWLEQRGQIEDSTADPFEDQLIALWKDVEKVILQRR